MCDQVMHLLSSSTTIEVVDFKLGGGEGERTAIPLTGPAPTLQCPPTVKIVPLWSSWQWSSTQKFLHISNTIRQVFQTCLPWSLDQICYGATNELFFFFFQKG